MAFTAKLTVARGKPALKHVAIVAGSAEAQSDTISLNIDATAITKGDALTMIEAIAAKIHASPWPPLA